MRDTQKLPPDVKVGPGLDMVSPMPMDRMDFPGLGLDDVEHRVLRYTDLVAKRANPPRKVEREMQIHLTGNMERYMWSFDGKKFSAVTDDPIRFGFDERVRVTLVNDTMTPKCSRYKGKDTRPSHKDSGVDIQRRTPVWV